MDINSTYCGLCQDLAPMIVPNSLEKMEISNFDQYIKSVCSLDETSVGCFGPCPLFFYMHLKKRKVTIFLH